MNKYYRNSRLAGCVYEGDMNESFHMNKTLLHSVQFENKIHDTAPQCLKDSSAIMLCTYACMDFGTRMPLRQAPRAFNRLFKRKFTF